MQDAEACGFKRSRLARRVEPQYIMPPMAAIFTFLNGCALRQFVVDLGHWQVPQGSACTWTRRLPSDARCQGFLIWDER